ncbi:hypothetical protein LSG31_09365 [Fodinisporobacter ferrooxydans]|uniref:Transposase n=1 Tax=Fodinisporobacter ferrooxydans TaxID=2901836 RepID=A0ABY4CQV8_9BACL|nr:hypothetical protein LSG31_09365 [Alicyclobacillaceae bacterium MYW30-H2]
MLFFYSGTYNFKYFLGIDSLRGKSEQAQPKRKRHPAESLTPEQLKKIGYVRGSLYLKKPPHMPEKEFKVYRKRTLDLIWKEWNMHLSNKKASFRRLMKALEETQKSDK